MDSLPFCRLLLECSDILLKRGDLLQVISLLFVLVVTKFTDSWSLVIILARCFEYYFVPGAKFCYNDCKKDVDLLRKMACFLHCKAFNEVLVAFSIHAIGSVVNFFSTYEYINKRLLCLQKVFFCLSGLILP